MNRFEYRSGQLHCEDIPVSELISKLGSPLYVYSRNTIVDHYLGLKKAFSVLEPEIRFSVKSCWNTHILRELHALGAGMDVVSGGEFFRARHAGVPAEKIVAAGVAKTEAELRDLMRGGVGWINFESEQECEVAAQIANGLGHTQRAAVRVNPDVSDPNTPQKTTTGKRGAKFGVDIERVPDLFARFRGSPHLQLRGIHAHLGSPIFEPGPYAAAIDRLLELIDVLRQQGHQISALNLGGGFAADYNSKYLPWEDYAQPMIEKLSSFVEEGGQIYFEPGRSIVGNAGILVAQVQYEKTAGDRQVVSLDAGMTDLIRPALYDAYHFIWPVAVRPEHVPRDYSPKPPGEGLRPYDVVGPICESSDCFGSNRYLPELHRGDEVAIFTTGAYGIVQSSNYNSRPRAAEVLVNGKEARVIRARETYQDLIAFEADPITLTL